MVEPDQTEAERVAGRKRFLRCADGGDAGGSAPQKGSGKTGREGVLQVLLRAQFSDAVAGKLPLQRAAKTFAILEAGASAVGIAVGRIGKVDEGQRAGEGAETFNLDFKTAAAFAADTTDSSDKIFGFVPALNGDEIAADGQGKVRRDDRERVVAGLEKNGLSGGRENC